ncbi:MULTISPECIES: hypothetical protein [unclassified Allomuricauda]|uniref:hypothetical protein n=2 Tax=Allomuricauda TaxID=111500 RepID=UPI00273F5F56|nr:MULTISPECIES: hypothetical protein [unclassified Allomuricauda]
MRYRFINPKNYYTEFKQLYAFIIKPKSNFETHLNLVEKLEGTWKMFVVKFLLTLIIGVGIGLFYEPENLTKSGMMDRFTNPLLLFLVVFVLSLMEELAFRLSLKFNPIYLAFSTGVLAYYVLSKGIYQTKLSDVENHFTIRLIIVISVIIVSYYIFRVPRIKKKLEKFWKSNFRYILYFFCFGFAWPHILNYELSLLNLLLFPILTFDKLVSAFCYGYVRMRYGFIYSFGTHIVWNSIGFTVSLISTAN